MVSSSSRGFAPHRLCLPREQRPFCVGKSNLIAAQPLLQRPILGLKELDDEQLAPMNPPRHHHQQECQQWRHGTHARSLPRLTFQYLDNTRSLGRMPPDSARMPCIDE